MEQKNPLAAYDALAWRGVHDLKGLVACADLTAVDYVRVQVEREPTWSEDGGPMPEAVAQQTQVGKPELLFPADPVKDGVAVIVQLQVRWGDVAGRTVATAAVAVRVAYRFARLSEAPSVELLGKFAEELALHHAWPFLREKLRALSGEFGLPVV
ncbi:MAG: hypothetical protein FJ100_22475, partial [Deltaproteobacteria bacterium]|nr:hypothetical protein [Deltaproteobacteria bacterium]